MGERAEPERGSLTTYALWPALSLALLLRWCVAAYPYSGQGRPPMFGDYEAQRHWQEVTLHTPARQWYRNTTHNDLQYWGLDYPPLSAYHSLLLGLLAERLEPESVRLFASRGYEGAAHKAFMRRSVVLAELYCYAGAVLCLCAHAERRARRRTPFRRLDLAAALWLLYPGLLLVDHGHFQYNCVSLGLFLWATFFVVAVENDVLATVFFVLALNYKQMELYHALPFFVYLLRKCVPKPSHPRRAALFARRLCKLGAAVLSTFAAVWLPLVRSWDDALAVLRRLFPVQRGVFEDKVSNVWCAANVLVKLRHVDAALLLRACAACTLAASLPALLDLWLRPARRKFVPCLLNVALAFFLFSYQVHEKSILLAAVPAAAHMAEDPPAVLWFLLVSVFSMAPLLLRDGLALPLLCCCAAYGALFALVRRAGGERAGRAWRALIALSLLGMALLGAGALLLAPPPRYPDLFPLLVALYSCAHFLLFLAYFTRQQLLLPADPEYD